MLQAGTKNKLQIKLLSTSGEMLSCINCSQNQITVLRANSLTDLKPYQRALAGIPGPERFSITYNGAHFIPEEHIFIGFGEHFFPDDGTVSQFLANWIPLTSIDSMLLNFGLEDRKDSPCTSLTLCEERRTRLVAAALCPQRVLVMNEPFEPISSKWRERIAELLITQIRDSARVVVITGLSYRPECWVDSDLIAKVQVGESVQRTIGYGSAASEFAPIIEQLREEHLKKLGSKLPEGIGGKGAAPPQPRRETGNESTVESGNELTFTVAPLPTRERSAPVKLRTGLSLKVRFAFLSLGIVILILTMCVARVMLSPIEVDSVVASNSVPDNVKSPEIPTNDKLPPPPPTPPPVEQPVEPIEPVPVEVSGQYLLDDYSPEIKQAVIASYEERHSEQKQPPQPETAPQVEPTQLKKENLFSLLQTMSDEKNERKAGDGQIEPNEDLPQPVHESGEVEPLEPPDENAKRELIRQKFLEAIRNAAEKRNSTELIE